MAIKRDKSKFTVIALSKSNKEAQRKESYWGYQLLEEAQ